MCRSEQGDRDLHRAAVLGAHQRHLSVVVHPDRLRPPRLPPTKVADIVRPERRRARHVHRPLHDGDQRLHQPQEIPPGERVFGHLGDLLLDRRRRGRQRAVAVDVAHREPRDAHGQATAEVSRADGRVEALADVGDEQKEHFSVVRGGGLASGEARPCRRDDGDEGGRRPTQWRNAGFTVAGDALLEALDLLRVHGESPAGEPIPLFDENFQLGYLRQFRRVLPQDGPGNLLAKVQLDSGAVEARCRDRRRLAAARRRPRLQEHPERLPIGDAVMHRDADRQPSLQARGLHGQHRRRQLAHVELRHKLLKRRQVVQLVSGEAADVGVGFRSDELDRVRRGAGDGDVAGALEVDELAGERREARQRGAEGGPEGPDDAVERRRAGDLVEQDVLKHGEREPQCFHRRELDRLRRQRGSRRHSDIADVDDAHCRHEALDSALRRRWFIAHY